MFHRENVLKKTSDGCFKVWWICRWDTERILESVSLEQTLKGIHVARRIRRINITTRSRRNHNKKNWNVNKLVLYFWFFPRETNRGREMKKQDTNIESNKEPTSASGCALFCSSPAHDIIFQLGPFASFSRILWVIGRRQSMNIQSSDTSPSLSDGLATKWLNKALHHCLPFSNE